MKKIVMFLLAFLTALPVSAETIKKQTKTVRVPVIMYHHISEREELLNDYVITPQEFESDIAYLAESGYHSVLPSELKNGEIPENPVMITFDDGFLSTYRYALPILEKYAMTAVCAVIGSLVEEYTDNPNTVSDCAYMDMDTVKALKDSGVFEIACHTYDMHALAERKGCAQMKRESDEDYETALTQDLTRFNELYRNMTGGSTDIIAFPYGEYSSETVKIAAQMGYGIMLTCDEKISAVSLTSEEPMILGRFNRPHGVTSEEFFGQNLKTKKME